MNYLSFIPYARIALAALVAALVRRATRPGWGRLHAALVAGAASTVQVAAACAAAGIVVGVASLTGIGLRMSELIITLSGARRPGAGVRARRGRGGGSGTGRGTGDAARG